VLNSTFLYAKLNNSSHDNDEKNQLDATSVIYSHKLTLHVLSIYMLIFRSTGYNLLHLVFRTVLVIGLCCSVCRAVIGVGYVVYIGIRCYVSSSLEWVALWVRGGGVVQA
jgi:hypothetical protein